VSTTPAIKGKKFETGNFSYFVEMLLGCCFYTHIKIFYFMFILRCRQTDVFATVFISSVNDTGDQSILSKDENLVTDSL
jgi:hypothetical protein